MNITEILIVIVNIAIFILPLVMLIENLIKRKYKILNICILINVFIWIYLSYVWNIQNPGFRLKCDARILNLIASVLLIASIITFLLQIRPGGGWSRSNGHPAPGPWPPWRRRASGPSGAGPPAADTAFYPPGSTPAPRPPGA